MPEFVTVNVTEPAGAVAELSWIENSLSVAAIAVVDGDDAVVDGDDTAVLHALATIMHPSSPARAMYRLFISSPIKYEWRAAHTN